MVNTNPPGLREAVYAFLSLPSYKQYQVAINMGVEQNCIVNLHGLYAFKDLFETIVMLKLQERFVYETTLLCD